LKKILRKISAIFLIHCVFYSTSVQAFVMPPITTPVGYEIAQVMASRGTVSAASRVFSGLGPYGLIASLLLPVALNYFLRPDGTVSPPGGLLDTGTGGEGYYKIGIPFSGGFLSGNDPRALVIEAVKTAYPEYHAFAVVNATEASPTVTGRYTISALNSDGAVVGLGTFSVGYQTGHASVSCPAGQFVNVDHCSNYSQPTTGNGSNGAVMTVPQVVDGLTADQKAQEIDPQQMADVINRVFADEAAQPGYVGPAWGSNPVTATEVQAVRAATGVTSHVGDLAKPIGFPDPSTLKNPLNSGTTPPSNIPPVSGGTFDYALPASGSIEKTSVPVTFVPTVFAAPGGCPAPITFVMYGKEYSISYTPACSLMSAVSPIFLALGAAAAALIFAKGLQS